MQTYECTVLIGGSVDNEVTKTDATAAEIVVLQAIHKDRGRGNVRNIKAAGTVDRTDAEERERLTNVYGAAIMQNKEIGSLNALLGHPSVPLPNTIDGVDSLPPPKSGKRARGRPPKKTEVDVAAEATAEPEVEPEPEFA